MDVEPSTVQQGTGPSLPPMQLFEKVKFVIAECKDPDEVRKCLIDRGAVLIHYMSEVVTHVIADQNCPEVEEAIELYEKTVVTSLWVHSCIETNKLLPEHPFSPLKSVFSGITMSFSKLLSDKDTKTLAALLTYYGCKVTKDYTKSSHHLVTKPDETDIPTQESIKLLTPDWVSDSIKETKCCNESLYHPSLLEYPTPLKPIAPPVQAKTKIQPLKDTPTSTPSLVANKSVREFTLRNCCFRIVDYKSVSQHIKQSWIDTIKKAGGYFDEDLTSLTHLICETRCTDTYKEAISLGVRCVSIYWVNDVIAQRKISYPWRAIHLPFIFQLDKRPLVGQIISSTNFEGKERRDLKELILKSGAKYTNYMTRHNTLLICRHISRSQKYEKAMQWKIPVANCQVISDIILNPTLDLSSLLEQSKYQLYHVEDPFKLPKYDDCKEVMEAWKLPLKLPERKEKLANGSTSNICEPSNDINQTVVTKNNKIDNGSGPSTNTLGINKVYESILQNGQSNNSKRIFKGMIFFVTPGVRPNVSTISKMIVSAGGVVCTKKLPSKLQIDQMRSRNEKFVAISCSNDKHICQELLEYSVNVLSVEFVINGVLRQEINYEDYRIK